MTLSGSKVETTEDLGAEIKNVVVGRIRKMERHPDLSPGLMPAGMEGFSGSMGL